MNEFVAIDPITLIIVLVVIGMIPFALVMVTSFVKFSVVFSLIRNALGLQQVPPNIVLNAMAFLFSIFVMFPVINASYDTLRESKIDQLSGEELVESLNIAKEPLIDFLYKNSKSVQRNFFIDMAIKLWPPSLSEKMTDKNLMILVPSFMLKEITHAFQIGFFLYLPFIVIDLVVSNILLAMGMMMVSPTLISLPFKLLLFVFVDGWTKMIQGLFLTYQ